MAEATLGLTWLLALGPYLAFVAALAWQRGVRGPGWVHAGWWLGTVPWVVLAGLVVTPTTARIATVCLWTFLVASAAAFLVVHFLWDQPAVERARREHRWLLALWLGGQVHLWLLGLLVAPALAAGQQAQCAGRLGLVGRGLAAYHLFHGRLPRQYEADPSGRPILSWRATLLPFVGREDLALRLAPEAAWDAPANEPVVRETVEAFLCPSALETPSSGLKLELLWSGPRLKSRDRAGRALTHYAGAAGPQAAFRAPGEPAVRLDRLRGVPGRLLIAGEALRPEIPWPAPVDVTVPSAEPLAGFSSAHPGGAHFLAADGSVRFVADTVDPRVLADQFVVPMKSLDEILRPKARPTGSRPAPASRPGR